MLYENSDAPYCEELAKAITDEIRKGNRIDTTTKLRHIKEQKESLRATFAQGTAFYRMFGEQIIDPERKKCAYEFAKMSESNAVKRRVLALRYGFLKSGLVRNLALMFLI